MSDQRLRSALDAAETDLAAARGLIARLAAWINNPANDPDTCRALAEHLGLPAPRQENQPHGQ